MERTVEVVFAVLPETLEEMKRLPQASLSTPFDTAALTVAALAVYPKDREMSLSMLAFLKGPGTLSPYEQQFLRDRFMDKDSVPRSFFKGAVPQNDYTPDLPAGTYQHLLPPKKVSVHGRAVTDGQSTTG